MKEYLISIHHPDNYDPAALEDETMHREIDELNAEMVAAGIRLFVGGLHPVHEARSIRRQGNGEIVVTDGPYLKTSEHVGGFWVIEAKDLDEAVAWGVKATRACRTPVEVRPFHG